MVSKGRVASKQKSPPKAQARVHIVVEGGEKGPLSAQLKQGFGQLLQRVFPKGADPA